MPYLDEVDPEVLEQAQAMGLFLFAQTDAGDLLTLSQGGIEKSWAVGNHLTNETMSGLGCQPAG
jgi:hypothetical protein